MAEDSQGGSGPSPEQRRRLQKLFEHANRAMGQDNFDYATKLLTDCVLGDPGNILYLQSFLGNLRKKYANNKKGAMAAYLRTAGTRAVVQKAAMQKNWDQVLKNGLEILKLNPWDSGTLVHLSQVADAQEHDDIELTYLKAAYDADSDDLDILRRCARAMAERKIFGQALFLWHRVEQLRPKDEEAKKAIADLAVEQTISQGRYEEKVAGKPNAAASEAPKDDRRVDETDEERLMRLIRKSPTELGRYFELASLFAKDEQFEKAEKVLLQADKTVPGNAEVRERLEDLQLTILRNRVTQAQARVEQNSTPEAERQCKLLERQLVERELQNAKNRCERFPNTHRFRYEYALRLQQCGQFKEAIPELQRAKTDPRCKGVCNLSLGQCFEKVGQAGLAFEHYVAASEDISDQQMEQKKLALYSAGTTAIALQKREQATRYLSSLAGLDYGYRDVASLLDKLAGLGDDDGLRS